MHCCGQGQTQLKTTLFKRYTRSTDINMTTQSMSKGLVLTFVLVVYSTASSLDLSVPTSFGVQKFASGGSGDETCTSNGKTYQNGDIFRDFHWNKCILSKCDNGRRVSIRSDCVDSKLECHAHGTYWREGCRIYRCKVSTIVEASGSTTTKYEPVKIHDAC